MQAATKHSVFNSIYLVIFIAGIGFFGLSFYLLGILPGRELQKEIDLQAPADMAGYTAQEERGRAIYSREGCGYCHTQQVRFVAQDVARWGAPTQAWETRFDYPQLWGTRRIGPDLARESGVRSNDWQLTHLFNPRFVVADSVMPGYPWLFEGDARKPTADGLSLVAYLQALGRPRHVSGYDDAPAPASATLRGHESAMTSSGLGARRQAIAAQARLDGPVPSFALPTNPGDKAVALAAGKVAFAQNCVACHGATGAGVGPGAASLIPPPTDLSAARFTSQHLADVLWNGRYGTAMPAWRDLDMSTLAALTVYVQSLHVTDAPTTFNAIVTPEGYAQALFVDHCSSCHGLTGQGDGPVARSLAPRPANFRLKQGNPAYLSAVLRDGIPGTAMPPWKDVLTEQQRHSLVNYLRTLYQAPSEE